MISFDVEILIIRELTARHIVLLHSKENSFIRREMTEYLGLGLRTMSTKPTWRDNLLFITPRETSMRLIK